MQLFDAFIRFFLLDDNGKPTPKNGALPGERYPVIPAVPGDTFRFLIPPSDLGGARPESVGVYLGEQRVGSIRRQEAETYSEIRLRVNSAVAEGDYKQFAIVGQVPNPNHLVTNLAAGRLATASSDYNAGDITLESLTDGNIATYYSSASESSVQHDEWLIMPLAELSRISQLVLVPRKDLPVHFPVDLRLETSTDGINYTFCRQWTSLPTPVNDEPLPLDLPVNTDATHYRFNFSNLGFNSTDSTYRVQIGELQLWGYPLSEPPMIDKNLLGTFRQQATGIDEYIRSIRAFFESYVYTSVTVDTDGMELTVKIYHSDRFELGNVAVGVELGEVIEKNLNEPRLSVRFKNTITQPAKTTYRVAIDADIAEGNVYTLGNVQYTASRTDTQKSILASLGVENEVIELAGGTAPIVNATPGSYSTINRNRPVMQVLYVNASGGNDNYKVVVSGGVQPGNTYQVSVEGQTTRTYIAESGDAADVEAFFNAVSGSFPVPVGKVPVARTDAGTQVIANANSPAIRLTARTEIASQVLDCYEVYIGSSVQPGNTFNLQQNSDARRVIIAEPGDSALRIAQRFGYDSNPFVVGIAQDATLTGYAEPGPRYNEANIADIEILSGPTLYRNLPFVGELSIPTNQGEGLRSLTLRTGSVIAQGNAIDVLSDTKNTAMLRFSDTGNAFGMRYEEAGLVQQIRLPVYVSPAKLRQTETLAATPDGRMVRGETRSEAMHSLTTRALPSAFHKAMWSALKHRYLQVDGMNYQQEGEYSTSDWIGRKNKLMQATAELIRLDSYRNNRFENKHLLVHSESIGYVLIDEVNVPPGLSVYLQKGNIVRRVRAGSTVAPDVYQLQIRSGCESLEIAVYVDNVLTVQSVLTANRLNRIDEYLILQASQSVSVLARPATNLVTTTKWLQHRTDSAYSDEYSNQFEP